MLLINRVSAPRLGGDPSTERGKEFYRFLHFGINAKGGSVFFRVGHFDFDGLFSKDRIGGCFDRNRNFIKKILALNKLIAKRA